MEKEGKSFINVTLLIILIGGLVFAASFGISLRVSRQEVTAEVDSRVQRDIDYLQAFIDGNLQRIEDGAFSLASLVFGDPVSNDSGLQYVNLSEAFLAHKPSPQQIYDDMEKFMRANPVICGIAIEFERYVYPEVKSQYGFTPYVTNVSGEFQQLDLGEITNSFEWEWYTETAKLKRGYWCNPFQDSSEGHIIACYTIPVLRDGEIFAIIAVDIDTEAFSEKCAKISPYPNAQVAIMDRNFNFVSHPDTTYLLKNVSELEGITYSAADDSIREKMEALESGQYAVASEHETNMFYFAPVSRTKWMITILCPEKEVYGRVDRMKDTTTTIAIISILLISFILITLFRRFQKVSITEAGIEKELSVASDIQGGMLPKAYQAVSSGNSLDVFGFQKPAKSVGGDLYDYFTRDGKFFFCMGDVSGKGVPASLYMVVILALFRNIARREDDPGKIATELNQSLVSSNNYSMFCTMFFGVLDLKTGKLDYCNAGHNRPIIYRKDEAKAEFKEVKSNIVLGIMDDFEFIKEGMDLNSGDAIFLYTDGLTEAEDTEKTLFGDDATVASVTVSFQNQKRNSQEHIESVYHSVLEHTQEAIQNDDITMLMIRYDATAE